MKKYFVLVNDAIRHNCKTAIDQAPEGYAVEIKPKTRTLEQNALLHALLQRITNSVEWSGKKRDIDTWKRLLTAAWLRARGEPIELLPALDGHGVDIVFRRTSNLTVNEMIELVDFIQAWAIGQGIEL